MYHQAVASMVEECCKFVNQTPDVETKLKFIDTLRTVTEGKVRVGCVVGDTTSPPCIITDIC